MFLHFIRRLMHKKFVQQIFSCHYSIIDVTTPGSTGHDTHTISLVVCIIKMFTVEHAMTQFMKHDKFLFQVSGRAPIDLVNEHFVRFFLTVGTLSDNLSLIHISEPTRLLSISYAVFCLKKKNRV